MIFALGIDHTGRTTLFSEATRILISAMESRRVRRLVAITGVGAGETRGHGGWLYDWIIQPLFTRHRYADKERQEALIAASKLDWTIVRPALFRDDAALGPLQVHTRVDRDTVLRRVSRAEVASCARSAHHHRISEAAAIHRASLAARATRGQNHGPPIRRKQAMKAMVLRRSGTALTPEDLPIPLPGRGEVRVSVEACAVCRTDLHVVDGDLAHPKLPLVPGHEIVGKVDALGSGVHAFEVGERVGIPWLGHTCGQCSYCCTGRENLCDAPLFTGYTRDGGFAEQAVADAAYVFKLPAQEDPIAAAPLMCAGLIGWRSLVAAGDAERVGIYGFGAAAHIIAQVCRWQGRHVYAFTRPGDRSAQEFALSLGAIWAGGSDLFPPDPLDAAILFAPVGALVPIALRHIRKGGRVVCGGIHMSDIPSFPYRLLWEERQVVSVANLTRQDARDFLAIASKAGVKTSTTPYPLHAANDALSDLRDGKLAGAAVICP